MPINDLEVVELFLDLDVVISNFPIRFPTESEAEECFELDLRSLTTLYPY